MTIRQPLRARLAPIGLAGFFVVLTLVAGNPTAAPVFGAIGAVAALITLRMRLTVDAEGVTVVNIRPRRIPWLDIVAVSTGIPNRFATGQFLVFHRRSGPPIWSWRSVSEDVCPWVTASVGLSKFTPQLSARNRSQASVGLGRSWTPKSDVRCARRWKLKALIRTGDPITTVHPLASGGSFARTPSSPSV